MWLTTHNPPGRTRWGVSGTDCVHSSSRALSGGFGGEVTPRERPLGFQAPWVDRLRFSGNISHDFEGYQLSRSRRGKRCEILRRDPWWEGDTDREGPQMADNQPRSNFYHRRCCEARSPAFLLRGHHAKRVEGAYRYLRLRWVVVRSLESCKN